MSIRVFISYRRDDSRHVAGRLRDRLADAFGDENIFFDVDSIDFGVDFRTAIRDTVKSVDAVVAVIGPSFDLSRLAQKNDYVRLELEEALAQGKVVVPVLLEDARMPPAEELPGELETLSYRNAAPLRSDPDFRRDATRIIDSLVRSVGTPDTRSSPATPIADSRSVTPPDQRRTKNTSRKGTTRAIDASGTDDRVEQAAATSPPKAATSTKKAAAQRTNSVSPKRRQSPKASRARSSPKRRHIITSVAGFPDASLVAPQGVAVAPDGSLYIADTGNHRVHKVSPAGTISTVAGSTEGFGGDGRPATEARLSSPQGVAVAPDGSLYIADTGNHRVRKVSPAGTISTISTVVESSSTGVFGRHRRRTTAVGLGFPSGVAVGPDGSLYIADWGNHVVRRVSPDGTTTTLAGWTSGGGFGGGGGPATEAELKYPEGVAVAPNGALYIAESGNDRVRKVSPTGTISTVAGSKKGFRGDGGPATEARLFRPSGVAVAPDGSLYIADTGNDRVRKVSPAGTISTVAGSTEGFGGDGGPATEAKLSSPSGVAVAPDSSLYIADTSNRCVRKVSP